MPWRPRRSRGTASRILTLGTGWKWNSFTFRTLYPREKKIHGTRDILGSVGPKADLGAVEKRKIVYIENAFNNFYQSFLNIIVWWDVTLCYSTGTYQSFGRTWYYILASFCIDVSLLQLFPSPMQPKTVHKLSFIQNDIRITSIATCSGPTWPSSSNCSLTETVVLH
jgi:hypothetical protein